MTKPLTGMLTDLSSAQLAALEELIAHPDDILRWEGLSVIFAQLDYPHMAYAFRWAGSRRQFPRHYGRRWYWYREVRQGRPYLKSCRHAYLPVSLFSAMQFFDYKDSPDARFDSFFDAMDWLSNALFMIRLDYLLSGEDP